MSKLQGIEALVPQILVPSEKVSEIKGGKKRVVERKIYPGYVMTEIEVGEKGEIPEEVWYMVRGVLGREILLAVIASRSRWRIVKSTRCCKRRSKGKISRRQR